MSYSTYWLGLRICLPEDFRRGFRARACTSEFAQQGLSAGALSRILQLGHHLAMAADRKIRLGASRVPNPRLLMVSVGITLFVVGFLVTVASFSQMNVEGTQDASGRSLTDDGLFGGEAGVFVFAGILTSLAGVVTATVGPAISVMRSKDRVAR